jgi:hypothetical protein
VAPGRLEVAGGVVELGRGGLGAIRKHPRHWGGCRFALGRLLGRRKERQAFLRLRFHLLLEIDLLHCFLPGCGRRFFLMLALVWVAERWS